MIPQLSNLNWLNANAQRNYPLDDNATRATLTGSTAALFPADLVADLSLSYPTALGTAYISAAGVTPSLMSLCISAITDAPGAQPVLLAGITLVRPADLYRNYRLDTHVDGVSGWVAFGPGAADENVNTTAAAQHYTLDLSGGVLLPAVSHKYSTAGITSISKPFSSTAPGRLLTLRSGTPSLLTIENGTRVVDGTERSAIIFKLNREVAGTDVLQQFLGPCEKSPQGLSCARPAVFALNDAVPDCSGKMVLNFICPDLSVLTGSAWASLFYDVPVAASCNRYGVPIHAGSFCITENDCLEGSSAGSS